MVLISLESDYCLEILTNQKNLKFIVSVKDAEKAISSGVDGIIVQGHEACGHVIGKNFKIFKYHNICTTQGQIFEAYDDRRSQKLPLTVPPLVLFVLKLGSAFRVNLTFSWSGEVEIQTTTIHISLTEYVQLF
ncbi:hypothetical protein C5167_040604 [Papaver somniferum]|uniref:Nitronate monooxygenase domain-containing protein n=1 Tax=Papaver somniferum TaxID=3469 RepID=A0A4Y7IIY1_PAPSO|nr:hypothetical protein C5167_040604 [Papaver somniferum]